MSALSLGLLKGICDFWWSSQTEFKDWAVDASAEFFCVYLEEWKKLFQQRSSVSQMNQFLKEHCGQWAERASRTISSRRKH